MLAGISMALLAALCFAAAGALQHSATRAIALATTPANATMRQWLPVLGMLPRVLGNRIWWCGLTLNVLGFAFHSTALHLGSITIVQALLCIQLIFTLPFATARSGTWPLARDWIGAAATCLGIITLVTARGSVPQTLERRHLVPAIVGVAALLVVILIAAATTTGRRSRTALVGTAAGVGFSITAVLTVVAADRLVSHGWWATVSHWQTYALGLSGLVAAILVQDAFASGSFPAAMTAMIVADPIASWLWGAILFDQVRPTTPMALAGLALSGLLISAGVAMLAYSPTIASSHAPA